MEQVGTISQLWRYPVKSMQGELVDSLVVGQGGAAGDRRLAVVDPAAGKVLSAKRYADLLMASARVVDDDVVVTLPDGAEHAASDPGVHAALSAWLDHEVQLQTPVEGVALPMEMYSGMSDESTPLFDWAGPPGTWLDLADAHWLTTSSLAAAGELHEGQWDVRRFRPTALIDTPADGWVEDAWGDLELGADVRSSVLMPTMRCSMPSRAQPGLDRDLAIGTTLRDQHANNLGVYASITQGGTLRVGDSVSAG